MSIAKQERQVVLGEVPEEDAKAVAKTKQPDIAIGAGGIPDFTDSHRYSFKAKWALIGDDIQVQFFLPKHAKTDSPRAAEAWQDYWLNKFAAKLDATARDYFEADVPRLVAKYTAELGSWWFKAQGYSHLLDKKAFVEGFLDRLDAELQKKAGSPQESN